MLCTACGSPIRETALSCPHCGVPVAHSAPEHEDDPDRTILMPMKRPAAAPLAAVAPPPAAVPDRTAMAAAQTADPLAAVDVLDARTPTAADAQAAGSKAMPEWTGPAAGDAGDFPTAKRSPPMRFIALGVAGLAAVLIIIGLVWRLLSHAPERAPEAGSAGAPTSESSKPTEPAPALPGAAETARPELPTIPPVAAPEPAPAAGPAAVPGSAAAPESAAVPGPAALPASAGLPMNAPKPASATAAAPREHAGTSSKPVRTRSRAAAAGREAAPATTGEPDATTPRTAEPAPTDKPAKTLDDLLK